MVMANKAIPISDKKIVVQRLAQGFSTRKAIQGTSIASNSTAAQLAKKQSHAIAQHRRTYLELIEQLCGLDAIARARSWAEMAMANQYIDRSKIVSTRLNGSEFYRHLAENNARYVEEVPDWIARYKALKYIDELSEKVHGSEQNQGKVQINLIKDSRDFEIEQ